MFVYLGGLDYHTATNHWVGLRDYLQETIVFLEKPPMNMWFSCNISLEWFGFGC